jgi:hypothetical protein
VSDASNTACVSIEGARAVQDTEHGACEKTPSCCARGGRAEPRSVFETKQEVVATRMTSIWKEEGRG